MALEATEKRGLMNIFGQNKVLQRAIVVNIAIGLAVNTILVRNGKNSSIFKFRKNKMQ